MALRNALKNNVCWSSPCNVLEHGHRMPAESHLIVGRHSDITDLTCETLVRTMLGKDEGFKKSCERQVAVVNIGDRWASPYDMH